MREKLTTLEAWARAKYGDHPPSIFTLRRWARDGKIFPQPEKHGRTYYVTESAQYCNDYNNPTFLEAVRGSTATQ